MHELFYETLRNIQYRTNKYRIHSKKSNFYSLDPLLERALKSSIEARSTKGIAIKFITSLKALYENFQKDELINYFERIFIENEVALEAEIKHESHILHVIRVFLIAYNIITSWSYLEDKFKKEDYSSFFFFSRFCLSLLNASLFHDFGYIIEKTHIRFRKINQLYGEFLGRFKGIDVLPEEPIDLGENISVAKKIYELYCNKLQQDLPFDEFIDLFKVKSSKDRELDHGLVSAICFREMVEIAQKQYDIKLKKELDEGIIKRDVYELKLLTKFNKKEINIYACLAMLLHNFHMIPFEQEDENQKLSLNCRRGAEIIPYLLMVCDLVQDWDRKKQDYAINSKITNRLNAIKKLDFCKFGNNFAIFQINHILQNKLEILDYAEFLGRIFLSKQEKITMKFEYLYPDGEITISKDLEKKIRYRNSTEMLKNILLRPMEEHGYKIAVNHVIEGIPYYTIIYSL